MDIGFFYVNINHCKKERLPDRHQSSDLIMLIKRERPVVNFCFIILFNFQYTRRCTSGQR